MAPLFQAFTLFFLGAAALIDTVLLLTLFDRNNRRRMVLPLVVIVGGAWLYHTGASAQALLSSATGPWIAQAHWLALTAMLAGLLLMPSALLHGLLRTAHRGFQTDAPADPRYTLLYLPLLALIPGTQLLAGDPLQPLAVVLADWVAPYVVWLLAVNLAASFGFWRLRKRFETQRANAFVTTLGQALLILALAQGAVFLGAWLWPDYRELLLLTAALSPLPLALLVAYFIVRYNFLELVLKRTLIYGALVVAVLLFHRVFLQDLWSALSVRYQLDFAIIEAVLIGLLILAYQPFRQRTAEALRYLLGNRVAELREQTRRLAVAMAALSGKTPKDILAWFDAAGQGALQVEYIAVWVFDSADNIALRSGAAEGLSDGLAYSIRQALHTDRLTACTNDAAPTFTLQENLTSANASFAVIFDSPEAPGLVLFGRPQGNRDLSEEQQSAMVMLVEQLGIALNNSLLEAARLAAERRALQNEKLSTLGLLSSAIAHEVKNPLSSIKTIAAVMAEELGPDHEQAESLRLVIGETERLSKTLGQLLRFARPSAAGVGEVALDAVIADTTNVLRHLARANTVTLASELPSASSCLQAEADDLREIVFNLLLNAIEATAPGGQVNVTCRCEEGQALLSVSDTGPGIDPAIRERLFQPFVTDKDRGTGLGLYIVGRRVRELGGTIDCTSSPDTGTLFTVALPLDRTAGSP